MNDKDYLFSLIVNKLVDLFILKYCDSAAEYNQMISCQNRKITTDEYMKLRKLVRP